MTECYLSVNYPGYLAGSAIGAGVVTVVYVTAGMAGAKALTQMQNALQFGWLVPIVGVISGLVLIAQKNGGQKADRHVDSNYRL